MRARCPNCSRSVELPDDFESSETTCVYCGNTFHVLEHLETISVRAAIVPRAVSQKSALVVDSTLIGDYELLEKIGGGGMGVVHKARHVKLGRLAAVKLIRPDRFPDDADIERFHVEAQAAAQLDHPGIVPVYEVGVHEKRHFMALALVSGCDLWSRIKEAPLPQREAAEILRRVAAAVQYAHEHGIVHRDLKPENILITDENVPRVTDFGLAKLTEADAGLTATGQVMGTPSYMPPEQALGQTDKIGPIADVYSLGATLYCTLTGRPPFQAATVVETLKQVVEQDPVPLRQLNQSIHKDLDTICLKCLEKDPKKRFATARELADDLSRFLNGEAIRARPTSALDKGTKWFARNKTELAATYCAYTGLSLFMTLFLAVIFGLMSTNGNLLVILFGALGIGGAYAFACLWLAARMMQQSAAAMKLSMLLYAICAGILWIFYSRTLDFTMLMHATTVFSVGMMISSFSAAALLSETPNEVHKAESGLRGYLYLVFAGVVLVLLGLGRIPYLNGSSPTHGRGAKFVKLLMIVHQQYPTLSTIAGGFALAFGGWQCSRVFFSWFVQMRKDRRARMEALQIGSKDIKHCPPSKVYSGSPFATIETKSPAETDETKEV